MDKIAEEVIKIKTASPSASDLQSYGRQAAKMYLNERIPLNEAIVKIASECPGLTVEQVQRIVEHANNATYLEIFEKQAGDKIVDFDIASPGDVLRALDIQARPTVSYSAPDYSMDPTKIGSSKVENLNADLQLAEMFGVRLVSPAMQKAAEDLIHGGKADNKPTAKYDKDQLALGMGVEREHTESPKRALEITKDHLEENDQYYTEPKSKDWAEKEIKKEGMVLVRIGDNESDLVLQDLERMASLENIKKLANDRGQYRESNPFGDLYRARQQLQKLADDARSAVYQNQLMHKEATEDLTADLKQHLLFGGNIGEVAHAMNSMHGYDWTKTAMEAVIPELLLFIDPAKARTDAIFYEMEKGASTRVINPSNPMMEAFDSFVKTAQGQTTLDESLSKISTELKKIEELTAKAVRKENAASL